MLKNLIKPLQKILLQKGFCPGCGLKLLKSKKVYSVDLKTQKIYCACGRIFIYKKDIGSFYRATDNEV